MFSEKQLKLIHQMLINAQFKTNEARSAVEVLEICELIQEKLRLEGTGEK